jgi:hypothetical protein
MSSLPNPVPGSTQPAISGFAPRPASRRYLPGRVQAALPGVWSVVEREALLGFVLTCYAVVVLRVIPYELVQDSWLTLVSGREVAENGIPRTDSLTIWLKGVPWIDQQWLGQLIFYGAHVLGGFKLVMLLHATALISALAMALVAARSFGASVKSVALVATFCTLLAPWALAMRAQSLAIPMFVALVWLLASDSRAPSRRVFLVFPLLAVWANIHGTVTLACALVVLRGLTVVVSRREGPKRLRAALLISAPFGAILVSPYATDLIGYYQTMLVSPTLRTFIVEWGPSTPSALTAAFYAVAFATVALLARHPGRLTAFERLALLMTLVAGVTAIRSIIWFALLALVLLPQLVDGAISQRPQRPGHRGRAVLAVASAAVLVAAFSAVATRPDSWFTAESPRAGGAAVARFIDAHPQATVFADDRYADWLLWEYPQLIGRIAYDIRFELFTLDQLNDLRSYRRVTGADWDAPTREFSLIAFDPRKENAAYVDAIRRSAMTVVYRDPMIVVAVR